MRDVSLNALTMEPSYDALWEVALQLGPLWRLSPVTRFWVPSGRDFIVAGGAPMLSLLDFDLLALALLAPRGDGPQGWLDAYRMGEPLTVRVAKAMDVPDYGTEYPIRAFIEGRRGNTSEIMAGARLVQAFPWLKYVYTGIETDIEVMRRQALKNAITETHVRMGGVPTFLSPTRVFGASSYLTELHETLTSYGVRPVLLGGTQ